MHTRIEDEHTAQYLLKLKDNGSLDKIQQKKRARVYHYGFSNDPYPKLQNWLHKRRLKIDETIAQYEINQLVLKSKGY